MGATPMGARPMGSRPMGSRPMGSPLVGARPMERPARGRAAVPKLPSHWRCGWPGMETARGQRGLAAVADGGGLAALRMVAAGASQRVIDHLRGRPASSSIPKSSASPDSRTLFARNG
jgi:hypothetical protein